MSYSVKIISATDHSSYAGLPLVLLRGEQTVAKATTNDQGVATFDYAPATGDTLRVRAEAPSSKGA